MHTSLEMNKWTWLITLLTWNMVGSGHKQDPCFTKCYKGQHFPTLLLSIAKMSNGGKAKNMLSFIAKVSVSQKTFTVREVAVYLRNNIIKL